MTKNVSFADNAAVFTRTRSGVNLPVFSSYLHKLVEADGLNIATAFRKIHSYTMTMIKEEDEDEERMPPSGRHLFIQRPSYSSFPK